MYVVVCVTEYNDLRDTSTWGPFDTRESALEYLEATKQNCTMSDHYVNFVCNPNIQQIV